MTDLGTLRAGQREGETTRTQRTQDQWFKDWTSIMTTDSNAQHDRLRHNGRNHRTTRELRFAYGINDAGQVVGYPTADSTGSSRRPLSRALMA